MTVLGLFLTQLRLKTVKMGKNRGSCGSFSGKSDTALEITR